MTEEKAALAVGPHADDVEYGMAGTLPLLAKAGFKPHVTRSRGDEIPETLKSAR